MLIAVLSLGGAILGATTIAGLLTLYQIRATTDTENSAKAIFAADAGVEWAQFDYNCSTDTRPTGASRCLPHSVTPGVTDYPKPTFAGSKAAATVNCYNNYGASGATSTCSATSTIAVISSGIANGSERAFFISFSASSTHYP